MKHATAICALIALCFLQLCSAESLSVLQAKLKREKGQVDRALSDITRYRNRLDYAVTSKIHNDKINAMQAINNAVNPAYDAVRAAVQAAKDEGKDASACQETARVAFRSLSVNGFDELDRCEKTAVSTVNSVGGSSIDSTIQAGNKLSSELDSIFPSCYSSNILQMQNCIALKLGSASRAVSAYKSTVNSVKSSVDSTINRASLDAKTCFNRPPATVRSQLAPISAAAETCIKNA